MLRHSNHIARASRIFSREWRQGPSRASSSEAAGDPQWFQTLRAELLERNIGAIQEHVTSQQQFKFKQTLKEFLPPKQAHRLDVRGLIVPVGQHLIWFNHTVPSDLLLPDGTDSLHSPGGPWVRRLWSGGSIRIKPAKYFHGIDGFAIDREYVAIERIKDVQLRGENDAAKIFVTIERRFARLHDLHAVALQSGKTSTLIARKWDKDLHESFQREQRDGIEWGTALLKEERTLVFLKARTNEELEAFKAGDFSLTTPRYTKRPGQPDFSHPLTPTRLLLFRYSALTFNAHLIHLDKQYAQNVEGHRNLLVHGPLTLTLMLQAISNYVNMLTNGGEAFESIEYRNLAPLYCEEEMRVCGRKKKGVTEQGGSVYDVWIEGPTGGVAVKGTVRTVPKQRKTIRPYQRPRGRSKFEKGGITRYLL
ncbi:hypothetical protein IQ07DRAFT_416413 [Pyrenochaeta sp. DS3sAY3a]|nr:hypothetical protein IQ07DRAFT_416413 [Pyrenochaeta sp. DS3sAY3a]